MSSINFGKIYLKLIQFKFEELSNYQMEVEAFMNAKKKNSVNEYDKIEWSNIQDEEYKSFLNDKPALPASGEGVRCVLRAWTSDRGVARVTLVRDWHPTAD